MRSRKRNTADIAISKNSNESAAITECLKLLNADNLISENDIVAIIPNWVQDKTPDTGIVVGEESLGTLIDFVKSRNPKRIVIATGSGGGNTKQVLERYRHIISEKSCEFIDLNEGPFIRVNINHSMPSSTNLNKLYEEMTCMISFTQLKIHEEGTISGTVKNVAMSWPPSAEHGTPKKNTGIHNDLHGFIRAMSEILPIDLSVVSANPAMIGTGPGKGISKHTGLVVAGTDPFAVDTVGARLLGFKPQAVRYLYEAGQKGLGETDINRMNFYGIPLIQAEKDFSLSAYGTSISVDEN